MTLVGDSQVRPGTIWQLLPNMKALCTVHRPWVYCTVEMPVVAPWMVALALLGLTYRSEMPPALRGNARHSQCGTGSVVAGSMAQAVWRIQQGTVSVAESVSHWQRTQGHVDCARHPLNVDLGDAGRDDGHVAEISAEVELPGTAQAGVGRGARQSGSACGSLRAQWATSTISLQRGGGRAMQSGRSGRPHPDS